MMTIADEGGRGVQKCPNLADIICEQPLNACKENQSTQNLIQVSGKNDQSVKMQVNLCPPTPSIDQFDQSLN